MRKKLIILLILVILGVIGYNYIYKDHRDIESENSEFTLTALDLSNEFLVAPSDSEKKYLNKTIEVTGIISEINGNNLVLNEKVFCQLQNSINATIGNSIKIKGRCIGYDNLLEEIKLDQCTISN